MALAAGAAVSTGADVPSLEVTGHGGQPAVE